MASEDEIDRLLAQAGLGGDAGQTPADPAPAPAPEAGAGVGEILAKLQSDLPPATTADDEPPPAASGGSTGEASAPEFPSFESGSGEAAVNDIRLLENVTVRVQVLLGRCRLTVEEILRLGQGSVVELDKLAGEPLDILVNEKLVAQGEVLVLNENFCIRVTEIIPPEERG